MIIGCPECATRFGVPADALGTDGRKVRCAKCSHVWLASVEDAIEETTTAPSATTVENVAPKPIVSENVSIKEEDVPEAPSEPVSEEQAEAPVEEIVEEKPQDDLVQKDMGSSSVEEALAAIKGSSIEEPDFPLEKGQISEQKFLPPQNITLIGWSSLGVFVVIILLVFLMMQQSLQNAWPPITKIYDLVGMSESTHTQEPAAQEEIIDLSRFINITNDATVEMLADGTPALVIRGSVTNTADFDIELPMVDAVLRNERRQDIYVWSFEFDETTLKAGKTMPFIEAVRGTPPETTEYELMLLWEK